MIQSISYLAKAEVCSRVRYWQQRLGIADVPGRVVPVDPLQVTGEDGLPGAELVGVVIEAGGFTIVHTRALDESDVIHELLHVARPHWPHDLVELWTERLVTQGETEVPGETWREAVR